MQIVLLPLHRTKKGLIGHTFLLAMTFLCFCFFVSGTCRGLQEATFPSQYLTVKQLSLFYCVHIDMVSNLTCLAWSLPFCRVHGGQMTDDAVGVENVS